MPSAKGGNMIIDNEKRLDSTPIDNPEVKNVAMKVLISPKEGWNDHVMRLFELSDGGHTPKHIHPWPQINYILEGCGTLYFDGKDYPIEAGSYAFVPAGTEHQFKNSSGQLLRFICIVPKEGHQ
jgi:quercetin dioxygenase-like cupin family protein